jgi:methyl-accepting chemotaxis protein
MLTRTQAAVGALQEMTRAGAAIAERALTGSERLAQQVGALLVALQGHDATRQVLEHVAEELAEAEAEPDEGRIAEAARLGAAQVRGARERFVGSLDELSRSLRAIDGIGAEVSRQTEEFVKSGSGGAAAALVRKGVDEATHSLLQHVAHEAQTGEAMHRVVVTVEEMGQSVKDIQGIGSAVKIIALNALVETERAGESGRVLAVLAQGIGSLAGEVVQRTGSVAQTLGEIFAQASALRTAVSRSEAQGGDAICGSLERLSVRLSEIQRGLQAAVTAMHDQSRTLDGEVEALSARVTEARSGADRLAEVEAVLAELGADAAPLAGSDPEERTRSYGRYTMESERAIHDQVIHGHSHPVTPAGSSGGTAGLGDNVELF